MDRLIKVDKIAELKAVFIESWYNIRIFQVIRCCKFSVDLWLIYDWGNGEKPILSFRRINYQRIIYSKKLMDAITIFCIFC